MQRVKVGDVVLIHGDGPRVHWKLAVIKKLPKGVESLIHLEKAVAKSSSQSRNFVTNDSPP